MAAKPTVIVIFLILMFVLEGLFPHQRGRQQRMRHAVPHVLTAVLNAILSRLFLAGITVHVIGRADAHSLGLVRSVDLGPLVRIIIVLVLFDGWMYCWHLANHRIAFLWRFHRAHHADIDMDTTTALRFHPGELILSTVIRLPVVVLIGMSVAELAVFETMLNVSTLFHHSNLALAEKWDRLLRVVVVTPNMHRVHHSAEPAEMNSNFTSLLSFWDRLARTFSMREDTRGIVFGLPVFREERFQRLRGFLITPFIRRTT